MPQLKNCPRCNKQHKKRGPYCSASCGNVRVHSEEDKEKRRIAARRYFETPEGQATSKKISRKTSLVNKGLPFTEVGMEDFLVDIPQLPDFDTIIRYTEWDQIDNW